MVAGMTALIRRRNPGKDRATLIDALIVTTGLAMLSWMFLVLPYVQDPGLSLIRKVLSVAYPCMDVLLLAVTTRLAMDRGVRRPALHLLVSSMVCLLVVDTLYGLISLHTKQGYTPGGVLDVGWIAFYVLWGAAALHPSMNTLSRPVPARETRLTPFRLVLLAGATLVAPAVQLVDGFGYAPFVIVAGSALMFLLVVARMAGLIRKDEESLARERALREAGAALVAAGGREDIFAAALHALRGVVGRAGTVDLYLVDASGAILPGPGAAPYAGEPLRVWELPGPVRAGLAEPGCTQQRALRDLSNWLGGSGSGPSPPAPCSSARTCGPSPSSGATGRCGLPPPPACWP